MEETIRIPSGRIAVLIGKNGATRKKIASLTKCGINVDSKTGEVGVKEKGSGKNFYNAINMIKAIGRGFSPEKAFLLLDDDVLLDILDIEDFLGKKNIEAKKGRIIGSRGKVREEIEKKTECHISVFGKTISIIGKTDEIGAARKAIEMLLEGATHKSVFNYIERRMIKEESEFEI